jgi:hypothetical protein
MQYIYLFFNAIRTQQQQVLEDEQQLLGLIDVLARDANVPDNDRVKLCAISLLSTVLKLFNSTARNGSNSQYLVIYFLTLSYFRVFVTHFHHFSLHFLA